MKHKLFVLLGILLFSNSIGAQTVLAVVDNDENSQELAISTASRMIFHSDSLMIVSGETGDGAYIYSYSDVKKLFFLGFLNDNKVVEDSHLMLYPNPVSHYFILKGSDADEHQLSIFSMDGVEVIRKKYRQDRIMDVDFLKSGIYIVRVGNKVVKFVKK